MVSDLQRGLTELDKARPAYETAENYYKGRVPEVFSSARIRRFLVSKDPSRPEDPFTLNYARIPVVTRLNRIEVAAVTVPGKDDVTAILQQNVWDDNDLMQLQKQIHEDALVYGDAFVTVWPGAEEDTVEIDIQNPKGARLIYRIDSPRRPAFGIKLWAEGKDTYRANLYYADRVERWVTIHGSKKDAENWVEYQTEDVDWVEANPYGVIPFFHFAANGTPYGTPAHRQAYGPQDSITKVHATLNATVEFQGFPQRYALTEKSGVDNEAMNSGEWGFGAQELVAESEDPSKKKPIGGDPATIQFFEGVKTVGEFSAGDPKNFIETLNFEIRSMAQITETPMHYFDPQGGAPSGESLRTADAPLVKSVEDLTVSFTRPWSKLLSLGLAILGYPGYQVDVRFAEIASTDDKDSWETAKLKQEAGVPTSQVLLEAGYTDAQITEWGVPTESNPAPAAETSPASAEEPDTEQFGV